MTRPPDSAPTDPGAGARDPSRPDRDPVAQHPESPRVPRLARTLDAAVIACLLCAETFATVMWDWLDIGWSISPLYGVALLLLAVRHGRYPKPSLASRIASAASRAWHDTWTRRLLSLALATRLLVLAVGLLGAVLIGQANSPDDFRLSHNVIHNLPARYDAGWYLGIARKGYRWRPERAHRQQNIAFFPGFPIAMRIGGDLVTMPARILRDPWLFGNGNTRVVWGGAIVNILAFTLALVRVRRYGLVLGLRDDVAFFGAALLACAPFAYFFSAPYSEGLFLLASVSTFAAWRSGSAGGVAAWGFLAGLTRSNGWTVSAALIVDAALRWREHRHDPRRLVAALAPLAAAGFFSAYIFTLTGHPLAWMTAQQAWGNRLTPFGFATARWDHVERIGVGTYVATDPGDAATVVCVLAVLVLTLVMLRRRQWLEATFSLAYLLPGMVLDIPSLGRMTSVLFPAYLTLASLTRSAPGSMRSPGADRRRLAAWTVPAALLALQLFFAFRFFGWKPPY